jgi:hypothetical protein
MKLPASNAIGLLLAVFFSSCSGSPQVAQFSPTASASTGSATFTPIPSPTVQLNEFGLPSSVVRAWDLAVGPGYDVDDPIAGKYSLTIMPPLLRFKSFGQRVPFSGSPDSEFLGVPVSIDVARLPTTSTFTPGLFKPTPLYIAVGAGPLVGFVQRPPCQVHDQLLRRGAQSQDDNFYVLLHRVLKLATIEVAPPSDPNAPFVKIDSVPDRRVVMLVYEVPAGGTKFSVKCGRSPDDAQAKTFEFDRDRIISWTPPPEYR